jgi:Vanadium chloroperoxidase N-terminal domain
MTTTPTTALTTISRETTTQPRPSRQINAVSGAEKSVDPILYWNQVATEADRTTHTTGEPSEARAQGPAGSSRALAMVHLAMHDAYFGINPGYEPYLGTGLPTVPPGADADAAVAGAAHATLSALYPTQKAFFDARHAAAGLVAGKSDTDGHVFGREVAAKILALRKNDPGLGDDGYASSVAPGHHRQDPDNPGQSFYAPFYGAGSRCFAVTTRHHLDHPPQPGDPEYAWAIRQVRTKGITPHLTATLPVDLVTSYPPRTPTETSIGFFWGYDGAKGLGTPPRLYNQIIRQIAVAQGNDPVRNARLFAVVNAAMGDAGILAWNDKYFYDVWRPVLGIREHDSSSGPTGMGGDVLDPDADPGWLPLGAQKTNNIGQKNFTPNFPAYPSGHATFGAAVLQSVRRFYGLGKDGPDHLADGLEFVSEELNGINVDNTGTVRQRRVRTFPGGLWQMIEENGRSRTFLGVHWLFDAFAINEAGEMDLTQNVGGVRLGLNIANDIATNGLKAAAAAGPDPF